MSTLSEDQFQQWMAEANGRMADTPSVYDIEALLNKLTPRYRVEVWHIRHYMKWFFRMCYKQWGIEMRNPYWMPSERQRRKRR